MKSVRSNGLDTLRALAIVLVFCYHYTVFVSGENTFGWLSEAGWVGVDLFFVLSGYLIGNQVFALWAAGQKISLSAFYARRALRTWPVFWVVLALFFVFPASMGGKPPPPLWTFLTFTQNYQLQPGTAFSHAWSLCIEEQFYAVFPLAVLGAWALRRRWVRSNAALRGEQVAAGDLPTRINLANLVASQRRRGLALTWFCMGVLLAVGIGARTVLWLRYGQEAGGAIAGYYPNIYYATLGRFDEFLPGLALALLKNFYPSQWRWVYNSGWRFFGLGVLACGAMLYGVLNHYYIEDYGYGFFMTALGYSLIAWAFGLLVASALAPRSPLYWVYLPGVQKLALWSYSIYLIHKPWAYFVHSHVAAWGIGASTEMAAITIGSVGFGAVLYYAVELPFMRWRDARFVGLASSKVPLAQAA